MKNDMGSNMADSHRQIHAQLGEKLDKATPAGQIGMANCDMCGEVLRSSPPITTSQEQVNDLVATDHKPAQTSSNPPTPTSINEILEGLEHSRKCKSNYMFERRPCNCPKKDLKTALYTLIASVRPKKKVTYADYPEYKSEKNVAYNQALQDYDNAIKEALK